jgi:hypothetical protein
MQRTYGVFKDLDLSKGWVAGCHWKNPQVGDKWASDEIIPAYVKISLKWLGVLPRHCRFFWCYFIGLG